MKKTNKNFRPKGAMKSSTLVTKKQVHDMIKSLNSQVPKCIYTTPTTYTNGTAGNIFMPVIGTGFDKTIGERFVLDKIRVHALVTPIASPIPCIFRCTIIQVVPPSNTGAFPLGYGDVYQQVGSQIQLVNGPQAYEHRDYCHILHDSRHILNPNASNNQKVLDITVKPAIKNVIYDNANTTLVTGYPFVLFEMCNITGLGWGNASTYSCNWTAEVWFRDT